MSGGGGGRGTGGHKRSVSNCATLVIVTGLFSPAPLIIATLKVGDELRLEYTAPKGPVTVVAQDDSVVGALLHKDIVDLINCIEQGYEYRVIVQSISGGNCTVKITR